MVIALMVIGVLSVVAQVVGVWLTSRVLQRLGALESKQEKMHADVLEAGKPVEAEVLARCADMGIGLAERMSKLQRGPVGEKRLQSDDKLRIALAFAAEAGRREGFVFSDADLRKTIEARLEVMRVAKSWRRTS